MSPAIPGWSVASSCPCSHDNGVHKSWLNNLGCLTHFRFPHLPVKVSFYTGGSFHIDKHKEKSEREKGRKPTHTDNTYCQQRHFTHAGSFNFLNNLPARYNHPQSTHEEKETETQVFPHHLKTASLNTEPSQRPYSAGVSAGVSVHRH